MVEKVLGTRAIQSQKNPQIKMKLFHSGESLVTVEDAIMPCSLVHVNHSIRRT